MHHTMQQLDIFGDSRDRVLQNQFADAATGGDLQQMLRCIAALHDEFPDDRHLAPAAVLIDAMQAEAQCGDAALPDPASALAARAQLQHAVHPAAQAVLGTQAAAPWMAARWRALAGRARMLPFDHTGADVHAAALWLQAGAWAEAAQALHSIECWRRKPIPLAWMAQARWHLSGPDASWPLLAELAWLAPARLPPLLAQLPDSRLHKLARAYEAAFDTAPDWAWWPAWLLVEQPLLLAPLESAQTAGEAPPERSFKLLQSLLRLERQGRHHEIIEQRRRLQSLHPALFAAYMRTR